MSLNKLDNLGKNLKKKAKSKDKIQIQEVAPVSKEEITRATIELPTEIHTRLKIHLASSRATFKDWACDAIIEKLQKEGVKL